MTSNLTISSRPPVIRGWGTFDPAEIESAKDNRILKLLYAGVSAACDIGCVYCQTKSGRAIPGEMTLDERKELLRQARDLGCEWVHIAARGEPTVDPLFPDQLRHIHDLDMIPVVYTHGANIDGSWADLLWQCEASVMLKVHSLDFQLQDRLAARRGYAARRALGLKNLLERGFTSTSPTRLGADILIMRTNLQEIEGIFRWCRESNIFPLVKAFMCNERGASKYVRENLYVPPLQVREVFQHLAEIDRRDYGYDWDPTPPYAGINCNYYNYHLVVTVMGDVWPCIGLSHLELGNIRSRSLRDCWLDPSMDKIRHFNDHVSGICTACDKRSVCYGCPCRRTYLKGPSATFNCESCWEDNL